MRYAALEPSTANTLSREVTIAGIRLDLSAKEYQLLTTLGSAPERVFDWRRGLKFSTYAVWWIHQSIQRAVAQRGRVIALPVHVSQELRKLEAAERRLGARGGDPGDTAALAPEASLTEPQVRALRTWRTPSGRWTLCDNPVPR